MKTVAEIIDPWLDGDPCEGCTKCERVCRKLTERIQEALAELEETNNKLRARLYLNKIPHGDIE